MKREAVIDQIEDLQRDDTKLSQMAILVRASFLMRGFEEQFEAGIAYRVIGFDFAGQRSS